MIENIGYISSILLIIKFVIDIKASEWYLGTKSKVRTMDMYIHLYHPFEVSFDSRGGVTLL